MAETNMAMAAGTAEARKWTVIANLSIVALVCYQAVLCFAHTNVAQLTNSVVAVAEASILIVTAASIVCSEYAKHGAHLIFVAAYFAGLWMMRGDMDPEELRNILIILMFFTIGTMVSDRRAVDRLVTILSLIVVVFGVLEYFFSDVYLTYFNIFDYYVSRGVLDGHVPTYLKDSLYLSGIRPVGRTLFPLIGDQRISSVFLEPVSLGNYAVVVAIWGLSYDFAQWRMALKHVVLAVVFAIACDSRFASIIIFFIILARIVPAIQSRAVVFLLPLMAVLVLMLYAAYGTGHAGEDDFAGRIMLSALAVSNMSMGNLLGVGYPEPLSDMGIAYSIENFGVLLCVVLWTVFSCMKIESKYGRRLRAMTAIYCIGILTISGTSFFSAKTGAILWFMLGASLAGAGARHKRIQTETRGEIGTVAPAGGYARLSNGVQRQS